MKGSFLISRRPARVIAASLLAALTLAAPSRAAEPSPQQLSADYAVCLGRLNAAAEHLGSVQDPSADALALRRDWMKALYDATRLTQPGDTASRESHITLRIRARRDQQKLLEAGAFGSDARRARLAEATAMRQLFTCHQLVTR